MGGGARLWLWAALAIAPLGCASEKSSSSSSADAGGATGGTGGAAGASGTGGTAGAACYVGEGRCEGFAVAHCQADGSWSAAAPCPGELQVCNDGQCGDPSSAQQAQLDAIEEYVGALVDRSGWSEALNESELLAVGHESWLQGGGAEQGYFRALRSIHLRVPQGHQSLSAGIACGRMQAPVLATSRYGVCGRARGDAIVVTVAAEGNTLGLEVGDQVAALGGLEGPELFGEVNRRLICTTSSPSEAHHRGGAASSFFAAIEEGEELTVHRPDGEVVTVAVPAPSTTLHSCQDPFGKDIGFDALAHRVGDVGIVRLPRFFPMNPPPYDPNDPSSYDAVIAHMRQQVLDAFDTVKDAPMLIWDVRGNYGGVTQVALDIVAGMPSARETFLSYCEARQEETQPPSFGPFTYAQYSVTPGGPFTYEGKVAVLIDELAYSATDYFALAVQRATDVLIVGAPTAGAYGGSGPEEALAAEPAATFTIDVNRCVDGTTLLPLEGRSIEPDVRVEYEPDDLQLDRDSVLEAAMAALMDD